MVQELSQDNLSELIAGNSKVMVQYSASCVEIVEL